MSQPPSVRFGDGSPCPYAPTVLEELGSLIVFAGRAGRGYGDTLSLERRKLEADEKAASVRADLQRMLRDGQAALTASAQTSSWPEVRERARKAATELQSLVERWQEHANASAEQSHKTLSQYQRNIASTMREDLFAYLRTCLDAAIPRATLIRRLGTERYVDEVRLEITAGLRSTFDVDPTHCDPPQRLRALMQRVAVRAGVRKGLFGGQKPREVRLDGHYLVEAVLGPAAIDLRLAPKLKAASEAVLLRLRPEAGQIQGQITLEDSSRHVVEGEDTLQELWNALQRLRVQAAARPVSVSSVELDGTAPADGRDYYACAERIVDGWRPVVTELMRHTPGPDELCVIVANDAGLDDELWVRTADLTQHLLTIPATIRGRVSPTELLGPAEVTRESDIIELGTVDTPDAGDDSDVIALHYIPPAPANQVVEAGAPSPIVELTSGEISILEVGRDPEENSGCYELSKLGRSAP